MKYDSTVYGLCIVMGVKSPGESSCGSYWSHGMGLASCLPNQLLLLGFQLDYISVAAFEKRCGHTMKCWPKERAAVKPTLPGPAHGCQAGETVCCFRLAADQRQRDPGEDPWRS